MKLEKYYEKKVRILSTNGKVFEGIVSDYVYPEDNENNLESIIIDCVKGPFPGCAVEFWEKDIKTIEII